MLRLMPLGIILVDHGSRRAESNAQLNDMAARVARLRPEAEVRAAHMEIAEPSIDKVFRELVVAGCDEVQVLLYFLSDGRHVREDTPELVRAAAAQFPGIRVKIGAALGPDDMLAELMLRRVEQ
jgi:sirohydrochlorin ferrochelatase